MTIASEPESQAKAHIGSTAWHPDLARDRGVAGRHDALGHVAVANQHGLWLAICVGHRAVDGWDPVLLYAFRFHHDRLGDGLVVA